MGVCVMVLGRPGAGKSTSMRNFEPGEVGVFNVLGKRMPFKKRLDCADGCGYDLIRKTLAANRKRAYVVDDSTFLMANENFDRSMERGFDKFTDMARKFQGLVTQAGMTDDDTIVYFMHHYVVDDDGTMKVQTVGKMLDRTWPIDGAFLIVLHCTVIGGRHVFVHESDGMNLAKAPMGMFEPGPMDNDLKAVDAAIRDYWGMAPLTREEQK